MSKKGFAALSKDKHVELSGKGGRAKVPKGYSKLSPEQRSANASKAARVRWEREKLRRQHEISV